MRFSGWGRGQGRVVHIGLEGVGGSEALLFVVFGGCEVVLVLVVTGRLAQNSKIQKTDESSPAQ